MKERLKVALVIPSLDFGGAQRFTINLCKFLTSRGIEVHVVALRKSKEKNLKKEFELLKIKLVNLEKQKAIYALYELVRYIYFNNINIILSTVHNIDFIAAIAKCCKPRTKLIIRKASILYKKNLKDRIFSNDIFQNLLANKIIVLTDEMKNIYYKKKFAKNKVIVINNMVDTGHIFKQRNKKVDHNWLVNDEIFVIVANGRLVYEKGYDILLKAFEEINTNIPNTRLIIIGDGILKKKIENSIDENIKSKIEFLGYQDNPYQYMYRSNLFVLSSRYEGFPNVLLEAFACELPIVSTNCTSGPKEIIENNVNGILVPVNDKEALAKAVSKLVLNGSLRKKISKEGYNDLEKYSLESIGGEYLRLFIEEL